MEINQPLENALKLAELDLDRIQYIIEEDFSGSMDSYFIYVKQLSTDFESALSVLVLNSSNDKILTFATLNLRKIEIAIETINVVSKAFSNNRIEIDRDFTNIELIDDFFRPVFDAHLSQLVYIKKLLKDVLDGIGGGFSSVNIKSEDIIVPNIEPVEENIVAETKDLLSEYGEFLSIKDMEAIFKVKRNAIHNYEKEGYFKRCTPKNKTVMFNKEEIKNYLITRI